MLRPFLLVGVGGSGGKTLRVVRDDLERRLAQAGWSGPLPRAWQFVHVDVPTVADGNDPDLPPQLPERDYQGLVGAGIDYRTIDQAMVNNPGAHVKDALGGWRPDPNRVNVPASKGAGQYRALGRVITVASLNRVYAALQAARRNLTGAEVIGELQAVTTKLGGKSATVAQEPTVIVVSSMAGGSGSGAVIDVCDALRALGDKWAGESVGVLYAPDVFDYLPEEARRGVRPNSLAALAELMNGYWNTDGAGEGTSELFARYGVQLGASRRMGPRYPFLVGARNENVTYRTQNDVYRAMGRSLAAWVASESLQDKLTAYVQTQWAATASSVRDKLPLHPAGTETPFVALGSARVGLGRDRFQDYAAEHLARSVVERFLHRHEELRQRGDDRTARHLIRDTAEQAFGGFLGASGLDERGEVRNQIVDALQPASMREDLRATYQQSLAAVKETIPAKGAKAGDVRRAIRNAVADRRSQFQTNQLAARTAAGREWVTSIQAQLTALVARSIAQHGASVTAELLRRLTTEVKAVRDELQTEAAHRRRWAADVEQQIHGALDDPETALILATTAKLDEAVKRAVQTLQWEQEAEIRQLAITLIPDLASNVLEPLTQAVDDAVEALSEQERGSVDGQPSAISQWPTADIIPVRLRPAPNEFLLEGAEDYPTILADLLVRTTGLERAASARRAAEQQVLLGARTEDDVDQRLLVVEQDWTPIDHTLHLSVSSAPTRARFAVRVKADDVLARANAWLLSPGTAIGNYVTEGLRDYLDPDKASPAEHSQRLGRFEGQLIAALNAGAPLVSVNTSVLVQVHDRSEVAYSVSFSEVPLPDRSPAKERFQKVLEARGEWGEGVAKAFTDSGSGFIDLFTVLAEPYEPVVFDSLMRPVASEWGTRNKADDTRAEFWRWRRSRPLPEALPMAPSAISAMVRGWFVAGSLKQLELSPSGVKIFVPSEVGRGGAYADFPWPPLQATSHDSPDVLPALLESISLAMVAVNTSESLDAIKPYARLAQLGQGDEHRAPDELATWVLQGVRANDSQEGVGDWAQRQAEVSQRLAKLQDAYQGLFAKADASTDVLGHSGAYELRHYILAALGDLQRAVSGLQATVNDIGWQ